MINEIFYFKTVERVIWKQLVCLSGEVCVKGQKNIICDEFKQTAYAIVGSKVQGTATYSLDWKARYMKKTKMRLSVAGQKNIGLEISTTFLKKLGICYYRKLC
jgi:hypothetical protein